MGRGEAAYQIVGGRRIVWRSARQRKQTLALKGGDHGVRRIETVLAEDPVSQSKKYCTTSRKLYVLKTH